MEEKKANHANLEKKRAIFLQIGYLITLAVILMAFEWSTVKRRAAIPEFTTKGEVEESIINTFQDDKPLERPKPEIFITQMFQMIDDEAIDIDDIITFDVTDDQNSKNNYKVNFEPESYDNTVFFVPVEDMPIFRPAINKTQEEADIDLHNYVASRVEYPEMARANGIEGKVYVSFVVDKKGKVKDVKVARKTDPLLETEAIKVVKALPDFLPGRQRGQEVNVSYSVAINFRLG